MPTANKTTKTQEMVRVDSTQLIYLRYYNELTGVPVAALVREAVEQWLDTFYASRVSTIEKQRGLPASTADSEKPKDLQKAFDNMVSNLKTLQEAKDGKKHLTTKA
jgi:hypothetical protein